jgi:hypothetical protein
MAENPGSETEKSGPSSPLSRILLSRTCSRALLVFGILATAAAWRIDQAVSTAYRTNWVARRFSLEQQGAIFGCDDCWRLPSHLWLWASALAGALGILLLLASTLLFHERHWILARQAADESAADPKTLAGVRNLALFGGMAVVGLALADLVVRYLAASGRGQGLVTLGKGFRFFVSSRSRSSSSPRRQRRARRRRFSSASAAFSFASA